ncbi:molybdenum cofactor biosynthesis protein MoaE [Pseudooceanicola sp. HF7]|uniref:molybdenum cofactor biosynthesis protein MoaE n=1 Tax=Pseudooceanicola sp. HF7 TaxID=2721560 RepID=UPI00142FBF44|nr:molybdenum cofactor biosynthesis protein MoaE [Pseudooceanicola sp. HF7]NIZ08280.1 molybdenum cofactor biosynthesis protein MoaE [Pseudooceanicola sp. HF7]
MSGKRSAPEIRVQPAPFDPGAVLSEFTAKAALAGAGALVSFTGLVRDIPGAETLDHMEIEHYPGMTESALTSIAEEAMTRWAVSPVLILHRFGTMRPEEPIMMVATASAHRQDAFLAADFLMDYLKSRAPFWKKEVTTGGTAWVAAKDSDEHALKRWSED